jgi:hypothetical protein
MKPTPPSTLGGRQRGAVAVTTALALLVLLGFVGLVIDTARLQVARSELQNAADACALAAVLELNGLSDAPQRASQTGRYVGGLRHKDHFQSALLGTADVTLGFALSLNGTYQSAVSAEPAARFARCTAHSPGVVHFLMGLLGFAASNVQASATATVVPSQSVCGIPMAMCQGTGSDAQNFGYPVGAKVTLGATQSSGFFTWADVLGTDSGSGLEPYVQAFMGSGVCDIPTAPQRCITIKTGVVTSLDDAWNARFGMYKQGGSGLDPATAIPDLTGYGFRPPPAGGAYADYMGRAARREAFQGQLPSYNSPNGVHTQYGASYRRMVVMPVVACTSGSCGNGQRPVLGWACALMLSPKAPSQEAEVEFRGRADDANSGCRAAGMPGGGDAVGPLVPVLVQ